MGLATTDIVIDKSYDIWYNDVWQVAHIIGKSSKDGITILEVCLGSPLISFALKIAEAKPTMTIAPIGTFTASKLNLSVARTSAAPNKLAPVPLTRHRKLMRRSPSPPSRED